MIALFSAALFGWLLGCACALAVYVRIQWRRQRAIEAAKRLATTTAKRQQYAPRSDRLRRAYADITDDEGGRHGR